MPELNEVKNILESLLFVSDEPLSPKKLGEIMEIEPSLIKTILETLKDDYRTENRGIQLRQIAGGYRMYTHPANAPYVEKLILAWDGRRLTQAALETLSIIAYRQPVTKVTVGAIRGVNSEGVISSLVDKGLVKDAGREKSPGSPILYTTTKTFLERFGLSSIKELPSLAEFEPDDESKSDIQRQLFAEEGNGDGKAAADIELTPELAANEEEADGEITESNG